MYECEAWISSRKIINQSQISEISFLKRTKARVIQGNLIRVMRALGDNRRMAKRIADWRPIGRRIRGRYRKVWLREGMETEFNERAEWKKVTEQALSLIHI